MPGNSYSGSSHDRNFLLTVNLVVSIVALTTTVTVFIFGIFCGVLIVWCSRRLPKKHTLAKKTNINNKDCHPQMSNMTRITVETNEAYGFVHPNKL